MSDEQREDTPMPTVGTPVGVDVNTGEVVGEIVAMQRTSGPIPNLMAALAKAQETIQNPVKNRTAKVKSEKADYVYQYADLAAVLDCARAALAPQGVAITFDLSTRREQNVNVVEVTSQIAKGAEWKEVMLTTGLLDNRPQTLGSAITYLRRYGIQSLIGITAEEDDDANLAQGADAKTETKTGSAGTAKPKPAPKPEPDPNAGKGPETTQAEGEKKTYPRTDKPISEGQRKRLFAIMAERAEHLKMAPAEFKALVRDHLKTTYGIEPAEGQSAAELIKGTFYDELIAWVEKYHAGRVLRTAG